MKYVGFVTESDEIKESVRFDDLVKIPESYDTETLEKIEQYLSAGQIVFGWMGYSVDPLTKQFISPHCYLTDGKWVWPHYYYYYIEKYGVEVDPEFFRHMKSVSFKFKADADLLSSLFQIEEELSEKRDSKR